MLFIAPIFVLGPFIGGMAAIGAGEFLRACQIPKGKGFYAVCSITAVAIPTGFAVWSRDLTILTFSLLLLVLLFAIAIGNFEKEPVSMETIMLCFFAGIVFPMFYGSLVTLRHDYGNYVVLLPMLAAFATDIGAYFVGVAIGKRRNITAVSPNKSLEGFFGGIFTGILIVTLYGVYLQQYFPVSLPLMACYGFFASVMTELGDLSFSLVKRQKGIKDYGNFIVGHGGILDRFDSMTFAAPALLVLIQIIPAF